MKKILFLSFLCLVFAMFTNTAKAQQAQQEQECCFYLEQIDSLWVAQNPTLQFALNPITPDNIGVVEYYYFRFVNCLGDKAKLSIDWEFTVAGEPWYKPLDATAVNPRNRINVEFEWHLPLITGSNVGGRIFQGSGPLLSGMGLRDTVQPVFTTINGVKRAVRTDFPGQINASPNGTLFGYFNPYNVTPRWYNFFYADFLEWACNNDYLRIKITRYSSEEVQIIFKLIERKDGFEFQNHYIGDKQQDYMGGHSATWWREVKRFDFNEPESREKSMTVCAGDEVRYGRDMDGNQYVFTNPNYPDGHDTTMFVYFYSPVAECPNDIDKIVTLAVTWKALPVVTLEAPGLNEDHELCLPDGGTNVEIVLTAEPEDNYTYFIKKHHRLLNENNAPTAMFPVSEPGQYTITGYVVDELGCSSDKETIIITVYELPKFTATILQHRRSCREDDVDHNGIVRLKSTDNRSYKFEYSKILEDGELGERVPAPGDAKTYYKFNNLLDGDYIFYAIDEETNCEREIALTIEDVSEAPVIGIPEWDLVVCRGESTTVTITATGGTGEDTYTFILKSVGEEGEEVIDENETGIFEDVYSGNYIINVMDALGCRDTTPQFTIVNPDQLFVVPRLTTPVLCKDSSAIITVTAYGGVPPYEYFLEPNTIPNPTNIFELPQGLYTFYVVDFLGCKKYPEEIPFVVEDTNTSIVITLTQMSNIVCYGDPVQINVAATGGAGNYIGIGDFWRTPLVTTRYGFEVIDRYGCKATDSIRIEQTTSPLYIEGEVVITPNACFGDSTASIQIQAGGGALLGQGYTYILKFRGEIVDQNQEGIFNNLFAGTFTISIKDMLECDTTITVTVIDPPQLRAVASFYNGFVCYDETTLITISAFGGTGDPEEFEGVGTFRVAAGNHVFSVMDDNGCVAFTDTVRIAQPNYPLVAITTPTDTRIPCFGETITISVFAFYGSRLVAEYDTVVSKGDYVFSITDPDGCTAITDTVRVTEPSRLTVNARVTVPNSCLTDLATVTIQVRGGTPPYFYNNEEVNASFNVTVAPDFHTFTVEDNNGCSAFDTITITEPKPFIAEAEIRSTDSIFCNGDRATVTITTRNGVDPNTYYLDEDEVGQAANTFLLLARAEPYIFTVIDFIGCETTTEIVVTEPPLLEADASLYEFDLLCYGDSKTITIYAKGGTGYPSEFVVVKDTVVFAGKHVFRVTDANGCEAFTDTVTITQPNAPLRAGFYPQNPHVLCYNGTVSVTIYATGGTGNPSEYEGIGTFNFYASSAPYVRYVYDDNGCVDSVVIRVTQPNEPLRAIVEPSAELLLCYGDSITITVTATGGTGDPEDFDGVGTFRVAAGTHVFRVEDAVGCVARDTARITQPSKLVASIEPEFPHVLCHGDSVVVTISAIGGTGNPLFYEGVGDFPYYASDAPYVHYVYDDNGCMDSVTFTVTQPDAPITAEIEGSPIILICKDSVATVTVEAFGGTEGDGYTYQWYNNGTPITDATEATITLGTGNYTVIITDAVGCTHETEELIVDNYDDVEITITANKECYVPDIIVTVTCSEDANVTIKGYDANTGSFITALDQTVPVFAGIPQAVPFTTDGTVDYIYFVATARDIEGIPCTFVSGSSETINFNNLPLLYVYANSRHVVDEPLDNYKQTDVGTVVDHFFRINQECIEHNDLRLSVDFKYYYQHPDSATPRPAIPIGNFMVTINGFMNFSTPMDGCGAPGTNINYDLIPMSGESYFPHESGWRIANSTYNYFRLAFLRDREITVNLSGFTQPGTYTIDYRLVTNRSVASGVPWGYPILGNTCPAVPGGVFGGNNFYMTTGDGYETIVLATRTMTIVVIDPNNPEGSPILNIPEVKVANATIYPNPTTNNINIKFENVEGHAQVRIANINGQIIFDQQINVANDVVNMNLPGIKPGVYFVNIISENAVLTRKLVVTP